MKLTLREQRILAAIEQDLQTQDPALAAVLRDAPPPVARRQRRQLSTRQQALMVLLPHLLLVAFSLVFFLGVGGLAIITGLLVLLRMICVAHAGTGQRVRTATRTRPAGQ